MLSMNGDRTQRLLGLRISGVLLIVFGGLLGVFDLVVGVLFAVSVARSWHGHPENLHKLPVTFAIIVVIAALTYLSFRAALALYNAQQWAAYMATGFGVLLLLIGGTAFYDWFHPDRMSPDADFAILVAPFCVALGLWWCVYLNLPHVKACSRSVSSD
jgi:hypothetical protein